MRKLLYISALLFVVLTGCVDKEHVSARLDALDSLLSLPPTGPEPPVNYGLILTQLDTLMYDVVGDDALEARWNLLCATAEDKAERPLVSDLRIRPAYDYYRDATQDGTRGDSTLLHRFAQSCFYLGVHYYHLDSTARMERLMQKSTEVAKSCHDHYTAYLALTYLSGELKSTNPAEAIRLAKDALDELRQSGHHSPYNEVTLLLNAGLCYMYGELSVRDTAMTYYQRALEHSLANDSVLIESVYSHMVYYYLYKKDLPKAYEYFQQADTRLSEKDDKYSIGLYANLYMGMDSLEKSREYVNRLLPQANNTEKYYCFLTLQKIALRRHSESEALSLTDSLRYYAWMMSVDKSSESYLLNKEAVEKGQQIERLKSKSIIQKATFMVVGTFLLFTLCFVTLFMRQRIKQKEKRVEIAKIRRKLLEEAKEREVKQLEKEVAWRSRKIDLLREHLIRQSDVTARLESVSGSAGQFARLTDGEWHRLELTLDEYSENFVSRLRSAYPSLSEDDVRLCMLQKLRLTNRQMANVFVLQPPSVIKRKQRLRHVMSLGENDTRSFDEIVEEI